MSSVIGQDDTKNKLVLTPSLLMRLFEWCHEDAKDDVAMHYAFENIIAFSDGVNPLSMEDYEIIIRDANAGSTDKPEEDEVKEEPAPTYDLPLPNGDTQVNHELCQALRNAVDSYYEGGINGNTCYDAIQKAFDSNEQCDNCCQPQISYNDIETYTDGFKTGECCAEPGVEGFTLTINCDDGTLCNSPCEKKEEELPEDTLKQIEQIVSLSK